jgi:hypothetical protein
MLVFNYNIMDNNNLLLIYLGSALIGLVCIKLAYSYLCHQCIPNSCNAPTTQTVNVNVIKLNENVDETYEVNISDMIRDSEIDKPICNPVLYNIKTDLSYKHVVSPSDKSLHIQKLVECVNIRANKDEWWAKDYLEERTKPKPSKSFDDTSITSSTSYSNKPNYKRTRSNTMPDEPTKKLVNVKANKNTWWAEEYMNGVV